MFQKGESLVISTVIEVQVITVYKGSLSVTQTEALTRNGLDIFVVLPLGETGVLVRKNGDCSLWITLKANLLVKVAFDYSLLSAVMWNHLLSSYVLANGAHFSVGKYG